MEYKTIHTVPDGKEDVDAFIAAVKKGAKMFRR